MQVDRQLGHLRDECVEVEHISIQLPIHLHHQCIDNGRQVLDASVGTHHHVGISSRQADIHHTGAGIKADDNVLEVIRSAGIHIVHRIDSQFQMRILAPVVIAFDGAVQLYLAKVRTCQAERQIGKVNVRQIDISLGRNGVLEEDAFQMCVERQPAMSRMDVGDIVAVQHRCLGRQSGDAVAPSRIIHKVERIDLHLGIEACALAREVEVASISQGCSSHTVGYDSRHKLADIEPPSLGIEVIGLCDQIVIAVSPDDVVSAMLHIGTRRKSASALRTFEVKTEVNGESIRAVLGFIDKCRKEEVGIAKRALDGGCSLSLLVVKNGSSHGIGCHVDMSGHLKGQLMQVERIGRSTSLQYKRGALIHPMLLQSRQIRRCQPTEVGRINLCHKVGIDVSCTD